MLLRHYMERENRRLQRRDKLAEEKTEELLVRERDVAKKEIARAKKAVSEESQGRAKAEAKYHVTQTHLADKVASLARTRRMAVC